MTKKNIQKEIIAFLRKQDWPVTTENVMKGISVSWNTAQVHLLKLVADKTVKYKKVGRQNQFWLSSKYKKEFKE